MAGKFFVACLQERTGKWFMLSLCPIYITNWGISIKRAFQNLGKPEKIREHA